ncbi:MAG: hypothetical protein JST80_11150 [Bdellovibrionales bacterium]|nr:hypothetical protein [Bdellovibrionales bacterium]
MKVCIKAITVLTLAMLSVSPLGLTGCMSAYKKSVGGDSEQVFSKIFLADYSFAWEAAVEALKASPMDVVNRENGTLQTKWIDNTAERNLIDSAGSVSPYVKAQYRVRVTLAKGFYEGQQSVRVSVQKEQQFQRDVLEGWKNLETDGIQENSLLYRIGKLVEFKNKIQNIENQKLKQEMDSTSLDSSTNP